MAIKRLILMAILCLNSVWATAVDLEVVDLSGQPANLSQMAAQQQWNIIMVWATYCPACKKDFPQLNAFIDQYRNDPVRVVGVAVDGPEKITLVARTARSYDLKFVNAVIDVNDFAGHYQFETDQFFAGTPTYMVYNPDGKLVSYGPGGMDFAALSAFMKAQLE